MADDPYRPQQTRDHEFGVSLVKRRGRERVSLRDGRLTITDDTVHPRICDLDLDGIRTRLEGTRDVYTIRGLPDDLQRLAVDGDLREILDFTQID